MKRNQILVFAIAFFVAVCCPFLVETLRFKADCEIRSLARDLDFRTESYYTIANTDSSLLLNVLYQIPNKSNYGFGEHFESHTENFYVYISRKDNQIMFYINEIREDDHSRPTTSLLEKFDGLCIPIGREYSLAYPLIKWSWILYCLFLAGWFVSFLKPLKDNKKTVMKSNDLYRDYKELPNIIQIFNQTTNLLCRILVYFLRFCFYSCPYLIWVMLAIYFEFDFFFIFVPQTIVYYIVGFYLKRKTKSHLSNAYQGTESTYCSVDDSYLIQRESNKSNNPIIAILDFLCQYYPGIKSPILIPFMVKNMIPAAWCLIITIINSDKVPISKATYAILIILSIVYLLNVFKIDRYYRQLRHSYLKKNNLSGPYGWGTLDYNRADTYKEKVSPFDISYGIEKVLIKLEKY